MTYSIVETIENGKRLCTVTPTRWLRGDLLYWPDYGGYRLEKAIRAQLTYHKEWNTIPFKLLHTDIGIFFKFYIYQLLIIILYF